MNAAYCFLFSGSFRLARAAAHPWNLVHGKKKPHVRMGAVETTDGVERENSHCWIIFVHNFIGEWLVRELLDHFIVLDFG